jgi:hypothetical protein
LSTEPLSFVFQAGFDELWLYGGSLATQTG